MGAPSPPATRSVSRDDASRHLLNDLSARVFGGNVQPLIHQMIDQANLSAQELEELRRWVDLKLADAETGDDNPNSNNPANKDSSWNS